MHIVDAECIVRREGKLDFCGFYIHACKVVLVNYMSRHVTCHAACVHSASLCCSCVVPELVTHGVGVLELHACTDYNSLYCCAFTKF